MEWRIGCSGYHYPDWRGIFYSQEIPQRKWFEYYCTQFNTLELNLTYFKFPRRESLHNWYARSPEGFSFTVKAPRHITHFKKFRDAQQLLDEFIATAKESLGEKLGSVLFQFPAKFQYEPERLARIVDMLDTSVRNVLEFRHESWWNTAVFESLEKAKITFCGMSHPALPEAVVATTDTVYYRLHGVPYLYNSKYDVPKLERLVQQVLEQPGISRAYLYFNNTADAHAIINAKQLQDICELVH
jgi:uncharacterized protein YecE (DUF72 family)